MKNILSIAALSGLLCVVIGAFGAHGLKPVLSPEMLTVFETGVRYQFYHTLALILVALLYQTNQSKWLMRSAYFFLAGIALFSGSLYALTLSSIDGEALRALGAITPFGGVCFIFGWGFLFWGVRKGK
ncbi:MAG: DUF423 domain-containing protein [Bacteroidales bacterium]|nr:DUF423 domain-containing protein [Bacteroidales bacterium]